MITSMNAIVMPMAIRQPVATHGARTPVPSAGALAGGTSAVTGATAPSGSSAAAGPGTLPGAAAVPSGPAAPFPATGRGPAAAPTPASTGPGDATRATARL